MKKLITNKQWLSIYEQFIANATTDEKGYTEAIGFSFKFSPVTDYAMSGYDAVFSTSKAAKMFFWYSKADKHDASITDYFSEYEHCIDKEHDYFNSNYGIYAYRNGGIKSCINELIKNNESRRACFCINNNEVALNDFEIDKLCTNTIHFFIKDARLQMVVQMRSSNFIKLLPYDAFMFSVFYFEVYKALKEEYKLLRTGDICMQIASLHSYERDAKYANKNSESQIPYIESKLIDFNGTGYDLRNKLEKYLSE